MLQQQTAVVHLLLSWLLHAAAAIQHLLVVVAVLDCLIASKVVCLQWAAAVAHQWAIADATLHQLQLLLVQHLLLLHAAVAMQHLLAAVAVLDCLIVSKVACLQWAVAVAAAAMQLQLQATVVVQHLLQHLA